MSNTMNTDKKEKNTIASDIRITYHKDDLIYTHLVKPMQSNQTLTAFVRKALEMYFCDAEFKKFFTKSVDNDYSDVLEQFNYIIQKQQDTAANLKAGKIRLENSEATLNDILSPLNYEVPDGFMPSDISIFDLPENPKSIGTVADMDFSFDLYGGEGGSSVDTVAKTVNSAPSNVLTVSENSAVSSVSSTVPDFEKALANSQIFNAILKLFDVKLTDLPIDQFLTTSANTAIDKSVDAVVETEPSVNVPSVSVTESSNLNPMTPEVSSVSSVEDDDSLGFDDDETDSFEGSDTVDIPISAANLSSMFNM